MHNARPAQLPTEEVDADDDVLAGVRIIRNGAQPLRNVVVKAQFHCALRTYVLLERERRTDRVLVCDTAVILQARRPVLLVAVERDHRLRTAQRSELVTPLIDRRLDLLDLS